MVISSFRCRSSTGFRSDSCSEKEPDFDESKGPDCRPRGERDAAEPAEASGPLYRRVYLALKVKIRAGGSARRPRSLHARAGEGLGVSRNTVLLAYEQLAAEGYLVSRHRGATSVAAGAPPARPAPARPAAERPAAISAYARRLTARLDLAPSRPPGPRSALRYDFRYGGPGVDGSRARSGAGSSPPCAPGSFDALGYGSPAGHNPRARRSANTSAGRAASRASPADRRRKRHAGRGST